MTYSDKDFQSAAKELGWEVSLVEAVAEVESAGDGFLKNGKAKILFEAHVFSRLTGHKYDKTNPKISSPVMNRKLYLGGEKEYDRLAEAVKLNESAALQSCSYGAFQIMGFHFKLLGYKTVKAMVEDAETDSGQLRMFVKFCKANPGILRAGQRLDFRTVAAGYNGPRFEEFQYDKKIEKAYLKFRGVV